LSRCPGSFQSRAHHHAEPLISKLWYSEDPFCWNFLFCSNLLLRTLKCIFICYFDHYATIYIGKMQKPLPDLLKEYDLPIGIFPRDATNYEFNEETRKLTVFIPSICEVGYKDSSVVRFSTTVTGYLEKGKIADIEGMKTKVMIWVKVTCIASTGSKLSFTAGMKKTRDRGAYEVLRDGVGIDKFWSGHNTSKVLYFYELLLLCHCC